VISTTVNGDGDTEITVPLVYGRVSYAQPGDYAKAVGYIPLGFFPGITAGIIGGVRIKRTGRPFDLLVGRARKRAR
jgi:hypothetical protein